MRALLGLALLPVLLLAGCAAAGPEQYIGKTGDAVLSTVPSSQAVVEYNVAGLLHVGNPNDEVTVQDQWRVVTACAKGGQLILGMVRDNAYMGAVKARAEHNGYRHVLAQQCT